VSPLRIAMIGQRGVPATFGGIEHHVEELGARLAARGHEVIVYCRTNYAADRPPSFRGMRLRHLPTLSRKHLDAIVHSALSSVDAALRRVDVVHYHAVGPGIPAILPRYLSPSKVVLTVHGLDAERAKWGPAARAVLRTATWMSARVPDATIVVSRALAEHYRARYRRVTTYIPNGVERPGPHPPRLITERFGFRGGDYVLFVGRLVPEKAPDLLIRAFREIPTDHRLVLAGGSSFTGDYVRSLQALAEDDPRVLMPGYMYGELLQELYANASAFVLPSLLEGLPLTLLEAASHGTPVVVSDIAPHLEVVGADGPGHRVFPRGDRAALVRALRLALDGGATERRGAEELRERVLDTYRWEAVVEATEAVYRSCLGRTQGSFARSS